MKITEELSNAYYASKYSVFLNEDKELILFASGISEYVRDFLLSHQAESCAFITAYNPESKSLSDIENTRRHADLLAHLGGKWPLYLGEGKSKKGNWPAELSVLIVGVSLEEAREIALKYEQNAFVFAYDTGKSELIATLPDEQENLIHPLARMSDRLTKTLNATPMKPEKGSRVKVNFVSGRKKKSLH